MQAYRVKSYDTSPTLEDIPRPVADAGQVVLRIEACGLNFADLLQAKGKYQEKEPLPVTLGMEVAGVVEALGSGVAEPQVGTRVAAFVGAGGLAEYGAFPAERCVPLPDAMDSITAAGFQVAYGTSHLALTRTGRLKKGENLLVLGAAGGVGLTAVEIGKQLGATVIACARGDDKLETARRAGADHLIDSTRDDLRDQVRALGGADVVYDPVGGDLFATALRCCNPEARILTIGFASGTVPPVPANHLLVKNVSVHGFYWGGFLKFNPGALTDSMAELLAWHADGRLRPHISNTLPLDRAGEALELLRTRKSTGKVVITIGQGAADQNAP